MGRKRVHSSPAERQRAYRERSAGRAELLASRNASKRRPLSRPARLVAVVNQIRALQAEYEQWRDRLPEFQEGSEQEARLAETIELLEQAAELLADVEPPRGYGRD